MVTRFDIEPRDGSTPQAADSLMTSHDSTPAGTAISTKTADRENAPLADLTTFGRGRQTLLDRFQNLVHAQPAAIPLLVLILAIAAFGLLLGGKFFSAFALTLILQQVMIVGIVAVAQTLVILTAGIDLSVGAIMVFSSVVMGHCTFRYGIPAEVAVVIGLATGALCGAVSGMLVSLVRLPPFIVTLGMWQVVLASNFLYSSNETIRSQDLAEHAPLLQFFGESFRIGGAVFTNGVIAMVLLAAFIHFVLNNTAWGRHLYAVGDDPVAAQLAGINTRGVLISVYTVAGLICAFAGWALIGRLGSVSPTAGQFTNIESITAVVIGGTSLFGGRGSVLGSVFGALIVGVFSLGLRMLGTDPQWTYLMIGALIIVAVGIDQWARRMVG
ncbi:ABC transporter permease [Nitratireductor indicus]|uniref:ABC transporter permease n=1 Tax=Nitratireductor indicus TaxID=721133 RepID=UPI0028765E1F|nr:ABC transporter permease [Nitratireductor indicus]MDS1137807.1 ABC transporter permease [Nitratireductor indicus]